MKRFIITALLGVALLTGACCFGLCSHAHAECVSNGCTEVKVEDVTGDDNVTVVDGLRVLRVAVGLQEAETINVTACKRGQCDGDSDSE